MTAQTTGLPPASSTNPSLLAKATNASSSSTASPVAAPPQPYTGEKLTWDWRGYDIKYVAYGEGPPIVLIHGFGASIGHWRKNIPVLAAAGHRVYALDLLGFGDSDKPDLF
ncbi:MAG: alpha/beta fold hydrolase, partial [Cyanobacteria bacterium J06560_2]